MWFKRQPALFMPMDSAPELNLPPPRGDVLIRINIRRNTLLAFLLSLLVHSLLFLVVPKISFDSASAPPQTIEVSLAPSKASKAAAAPAAPEAVPEKPQPKARKEPPKAQARQPKVIAQTLNPKPEFTVPDVSAKPVTPVPAPKENLPTDMASYVRARQAQRQSTESDAARQNAEAAAREAGPSEAQVREERIKRNLQTGTNGIFEITSLSTRRAGFSFRGWTNDYSSSRRQSFEVEASSGQDVRLVMIKKMISLIREHYQGDFNWDSHRLGRVIVLSARLDDNAGLEDFMMMEFFGANYKNQ